MQAGGFIGWAVSTVLLLVKGSSAKLTGSAYSFALPLLLIGQLPVSKCLLAIAIGLLGLAYVAKAAMDTLTHQAGNNIFEKWGAWFEARTSWLNKYKLGS